MFEDILGPSKSNRPSMTSVARQAANGKCNGIDVDGKHIYFNYVDLKTKHTYNIKYFWPDLINGGGVKKDDPVEIVFYDPNGTPITAQRCRRMNINTKKWDYIEVYEVVKR